jgi:hypothetical protein
MQTHKPSTFHVFVLQTTNKNNLNKAEHYWITKLQTQINNNNPDNLNFIPKLLTSKKLNQHLKINFPQNPIHTLSQIQNKEINNQNNSLNTPIKVKRSFASRDYIRRILFLTKIPNKQNYLDTLNSKTLRKILSVITNKTIQPVIPRKLTKPTIYLQHTLPPSINTTTQHKKIINLINDQNIKHITTLIIHTLHSKLSPIINKQKIKIPIPTTFLSHNLNRKTLKSIFTKAQNLLPTNIKNKIDISIVYKNLNTLGSMFFNYKNTAKILPNKHNTCPCHNQEFKQFLNTHNHIDTNNTNILPILEKYLHINTSLLKELADKGANFILQPYITPHLLQKYFTKDIKNFIQNITSNFKIPTYIFEE